MKIKIVLADDEPIILKGLRKLIPWEQYGMEIVGQAYDGEQLLQIIEEIKPDIVISDISMPHISGIDMIKEVHQKKWGVKIIFISAYQEFSYAKDAIAYGAVDYLVKPLEKSEMEKALQKAVMLIRREDEIEESHSKLLHLESRTKASEIRGWLERLTDGNVSKDSEAYRYFSQQFSQTHYTVGIVETELPIGGKWQEEEKKLIDFAVENILTEIVNDFSQGHVFMKKALHVFIINHDRTAQTEQLAERIKDNITRYLKLEVSIGLSLPTQKFEKCVEAYKQANHALRMTYFIETDRVVIFTEELMIKPSGSEEQIYALRTKVIDGLLAHTWDESKKTLQTLMQQIGAYTYGNRSLAVSTSFTCVYSIIQDIKNAGIQLAGEAYELDKLQERLEQYRSFPALTSGVIALGENLYHHINEKAVCKEKLLISRIKSYIDEHFAEDITLEKAASIAYMNPYYFSSFFKKHIGQNFKQYITDLRMKHAMHLLSTTNLMIYEVAEQCGYNNARHFSDMFKKRMGMLPQEYRQSKHKQ